MKFKPSELNIVDFKVGYARALSGYGASIRDLRDALAELLFAVFILSLPVTLFVVWPTVYLFNVVRSVFK